MHEIHSFSVLISAYTRSLHRSIVYKVPLFIQACCERRQRKTAHRRLNGMTANAEIRQQNTIISGYRWKNFGVSGIIDGEWRNPIMCSMFDVQCSMFNGHEHSNVKFSSESISTNTYVINGIETAEHKKVEMIKSQAQRTKWKTSAWISTYKHKVFCFLFSPLTLATAKATKHMQTNRRCLRLNSTDK